MAAAVVLKQNLESQLEKAKECLKDVDENIKKLTGRDPNELRPGIRRGPMGGGPEGRGRERLPMMANRRDSGGMLDGPPANKRRAMGGPFNRLGPRLEPRRNRGEDSGEDDELPHKPTVQSSIVATPKEMKSRKDCLEEQKSDSRGLARNRRMFGLLLGTLQRFKDEETIKREKELKRIEIEKKLEAAAEKEREDLKRERQELFVERRKRQADLRKLEQKMEIVKQQDEWEAHHKNLLFHIQTKTKPPIFYLPAKHTLVTEERLKESRKRMEAIIAERRANTEEELRVMDQSRNSTSEVVEQGEAEEESTLPDDENNVVLPAEGEEMELKEYEEESEVITMMQPQSGNDGLDGNTDAAAPVATLPEDGEGKTVEVDGNGEEMENVEGGAVGLEMDSNDVQTKIGELEEDEEEEGNKIRDINSINELESKSEETEMFAKDQTMLTEKEFEPIYD